MHSKYKKKNNPLRDSIKIISGSGKDIVRNIFKTGIERNNMMCNKYSFKPYCNFNALIQTKITTNITINDRSGIIRISNCLLVINFENKLCSQVESGG